MPFGDYKNFAECVSKNSGKANPAGYCAALHKKITGSWPSEAATKEAALEFVDELLSAMPEDADVALKQIEHIVGAFTRWAGVDPGNFTKCVSTLRGKQGISNPEALCAWLHHEALGKWPAEKSEGPAIEGPIVFKQARRRIVVGPVLVPGEPDHEGEKLTAEKIEQVAYDFMEHFQYIDLSHTLKQVGVPVSSDLLRFPEKHVVDGQEVVLPTGTWMLGVKVSEEAWPKVESGELVGFSVMGAKRGDVEAFFATKGTTGMHFDGTRYRKTLLEDLGSDWVGVAVSILKNPSVFKSRFIAVKEAWHKRFFQRLKTKEDNVMPLTDEEKKELRAEMKTVASEAVKEATPTIVAAVKEQPKEPPKEDDKVKALTAEVEELKAAVKSREDDFKKLADFVDEQVKSQALKSSDDGKKPKDQYPEIQRDLAGRRRYMD